MSEPKPTHVECARGHWLAPTNSGLPPIVCPFCLDDALRWRSVGRMMLSDPEVP